MSMNTNKWNARNATVSRRSATLKIPAGLCAANVHRNNSSSFSMAVRSHSEPPLEWFAKVVIMQKATQTCHSGPHTLPIVRHEDRWLFADLRLSEFRPVQGELLSIPFDSAFGKLLCEQAGIQTCTHCGINLILSAAIDRSSLRCPNCFNRL